MGQAAAGQQPAGAREVRRSSMPELLALCHVSDSACQETAQLPSLPGCCTGCCTRAAARQSCTCASCAAIVCALTVRKYGSISNRRACTVQAGGGCEHGSHPLDDGDGGQPHTARRLHGALH